MHCHSEPRKTFIVHCHSELSEENTHYVGVHTLFCLLQFALKMVSHSLSLNYEMLLRSTKIPTYKHEEG